MDPMADDDQQPGVQPDAAAFCSIVDDMTTSISSVRQVINTLRQRENFDTSDGISLLSLKHHLLLQYMQSLLLLSSHRAIGHTLTERSPPAEPFSNPNRSARGADSGDLVDSMVETRVVLEKVKALEGRLRYQIEKLVRTAQEPEKAASAVIDDPLAFRPNPQNLLDNDGEASDVSVNERDDHDGAHTGTEDGIYRPPRLAPVPYSAAPKSKTRRAPPVPTALRAVQDPSLPHTESTAGLGTTPSLLSSRAKHLKRLQEYEEENFGRVVMGKNEARRRQRDEEDLALGAELGAGRGGGGKNRRRGGLEDEFGDVLRSVDRGGRGSRVGDGYDELRKSGRKKNVLERTKLNVRVRQEDDGDEEGQRVRKRSRFEQDTKSAKRRLKKSA